MSKLFQAGACSFLALMLAGCAADPEPIWERQHTPAPIVAAETVGKLSLPPGHSVCLRITHANGGRDVAFSEYGELARALKARGIEVNLFDCETVLHLDFRFVGRASAAAANQMLAEGYGSEAIPAETATNVDIADWLGIWDLLAKKVLASTTDTQKLNLNVAVVDLAVGDYQARFVSRDQGDWDSDQQFYLSQSLALQIAEALTE